MANKELLLYINFEVTNAIRTCVLYVYIVIVCPLYYLNTWSPYVLYKINKSSVKKQTKKKNRAFNLDLCHSMPYGK